MNTDKVKDYLTLLNRRMTEISCLAINEIEKKELIQSLFSRYTSELSNDLSKAEKEEDIIKIFNHFINNILSILETQSSKESFKSMRRLILNEIHGAKSVIIKESENKK